MSLVIVKQISGGPVAPGYCPVRGLALRDLPCEMGGDLPYEVGWDLPYEVGGELPYEMGGDLPYEVGGDFPYEMVKIC